MFLTHILVYVIIFIKNKGVYKFMSKISKIAELAVIICVLALMKGIASYAASATVALHADEKAVSSSTITVTNNDISVWGSVSSVSEHQVQFIVPDGPITAFNDTYDPGKSFSPIVRGVFYTSSTNLNLYGNSKDDQKKDCIASGGIAD